MLFFFFFFNDTATTEIYTLSLHDALPIWGSRRARCAGTGRCCWRSYAPCRALADRRCAHHAPGHRPLPRGPYGAPSVPAPGPPWQPFGTRPGARGRAGRRFDRDRRARYATAAETGTGRRCETPALLAATPARAAADTGTPCRARSSQMLWMPRARADSRPTAP